jgi:3D (Asp-Asp-Asp) domain-containing protein
VTTERDDVATLLKEQGVAVRDGDLVSPAQDAPLDDGSVIVVRHVVPVTLQVGGEAQELQVLGRTVADALVMAGLDPTGGISTEPSVDTTLVPGMVITATDVFVRIQEQVIDVAYDTKVIGDPKLALNKRVVEKKGVAGSSVRVWHVLVANGVEGTRTLKAEMAIKSPVTEVVRIGTKRSFSQIVQTKRSKTYTPKVDGRAILVEATAYTPFACGLDADWIAWRRRLFHVPDGWGIVAVDRRIIPLGTKLFVEGYGYAVAGDTGSAIHGYKIDVCYWGGSLSAPTGTASASQRAAAKRLTSVWGRRRGVRVTILGD